MTEAIVNYLNLKLETVGRLGVIHCLAELRSDGTTTVPYVYSGTGQVVPINIDGGNLSYWRMPNPISFEPIVGKYGVDQMQGAYDLRLVVVARRKDSTVDDAFMPTRLAEDIANQITGNFPDLKLLLKAQSVSIRVTSIDTNIPKIWGEEFTGTQVNDLNYTRAIMALSVSVTVIGSRDCWQNECDIDPNILHIFDFCNPNVVAELTPTQVACLEDALCEPCADVTIDINGSPFDTVPSGGTLDIPVLDTGSNPVGSQSGTDYVIANNATYINSVQVTDQTAETDAFIAVELDGNPSGTWNAGTQTWEVTSPPCADGNIEINGVQVATVPSGGTEDIDIVNGGSNQVGGWDGTSWVIGNNYTEINGVQVTDQEAEQDAAIFVTRDGVQNGTWNAGTQTWEVTSAACSPVTFQINAVNKESIASGAIFNLITKLDGVVNSGSYDAPTDTLSFTSAQIPVGGNPIKTGVTVSRRTGDDASMNLGANASWSVLDFNNPYGNTTRFTDTSGGQTYADNIVIDWSSYRLGKVLGYRRTHPTAGNWANQIDACAAVSIGIWTTLWHMTNRKEMERLMNDGVANPFNYAPFAGFIDPSAGIFTSTPYPSAPTGLAIAALSIGYVLAKDITEGGRSIPCRYFTVTGTTLT